jgi:DNA-binding Lrp family transcriptional regulator
MSSPTAGRQKSNRSPGEPETPARKSGIRIDEIDLKILSILIQDSRVSYSNLAKEVGLSRVSVKERVSELQRKGVIERFTIQIPARYLGKPLPVFFDLKFSPQNIESAAEVLSAHPDVVIVYQMSGLNTLHVHGFFADFDDVSRFINTFLAELKGIQGVATEFLLKRYKAERSLMV